MNELSAPELYALLPHQSIRAILAIPGGVFIFRVGHHDLAVVCPLIDIHFPELRHVYDTRNVSCRRDSPDHALRFWERNSMQSLLQYRSRKAIDVARGEPDQLAYLVHDIHSVATAVSLMVDLLEDAARAGDDDLQRARAVSAQESCHQMTQLCAEIAMCLTGATDYAPRTERFSLMELLLEVVIVYSPLFELAGKTLHLDAECSFPHLVGNRSRMFRAISNLLDNGLKHTSNGSRVDITCLSTAQHFDVLISDDGPGFGGINAGTVHKIDTLPVVIEHIANSAAIFSPGTGLRYVSDIMVAHGGDSRVELNDRGGSSFSLLFPKRRVDEHRLESEWS